MNSETINKYHEVAFDIGAGLCRSAMWHNAKCNWLHSDRNAMGIEIFRPMEYHFYEGICGTSFFLFNLYKITGEKIFLKTALGSIKLAIKVAKENTHENNVSFYLGKSGLVYVLLKAAQQLNDSYLRDEAVSLLKDICLPTSNDLPYDIMHGLAGMIPLLIYAGNTLNNKNYSDAAMQYGEQLFSAAIKSEDKLGWNYKNENHLPHTGFAHGSSGMAYSMAVLFNFSKDEKYKTACTQALNYDDSYFMPELNNWKNIDEVTATIPDNAQEKYQSLWCYGAAGMGLARLAIHAITKNTSIKEMTIKACDVAVASIHKSENYSVCHGHFSNAELLISASLYLNNINYFNEALKFTELGYEAIFKNDRDWTCGTKVQTPSPCFMTGVAGIGNFYLRITAKEKIASGLFLEEILV